MSSSSRQNISVLYERTIAGRDRAKKENNSSASQSVLGPSGVLSQSNFHKRVSNYKTGQQNFTMRRFGTEITNTSSASVLHHEAVKKTNGLKNKFLDKQLPLGKREGLKSNCSKAAPFAQQNWAKTIAKNAPEDIEMEEEQEIEEVKMCEEDKEEKLVQDTKEIKAQRRKAILKELEV